MKILVTGAAGFVGSHLVPELEGAGHEVVGTDREDGDLSKPMTGRWQVERVKPDYVVHLAARYGRLLCADAPHAATSDNTAATVELASACRQRDIPILYTSSSEVYGDHGEDTITEASELRMPTTIYGLSKRWGEEALQLYDPDLRRTCIVRMNMLYGPGQLGGYGRCALATFVDYALHGQPMFVHRASSRSWLYISDAVRFLRLLIERPVRGILNLGNENDWLEMYDLAELICDMVPGARYQLVDAPANQIRHKHYRTNPALRMKLGWAPEVDLPEGLAATIAAATLKERDGDVQGDGQPVGARPCAG